MSTELGALVAGLAGVEGFHNPSVSELKRQLKALKDGKRSAKSAYEKQLDAVVAAAKKEWEKKKSGKKASMDWWESEYDKKIDALEDAIDAQEEQEEESQEAHQLKYYRETLEDGSRYTKSDVQKMSAAKIDQVLAAVAKRMEWIRRSDVKPRDTMFGKESAYLSKLFDYLSAEKYSRQQMRAYRNPEEGEGMSTNTKIAIAAAAGLAAYFLYQRSQEA